MVITLKSATFNYIKGQVISIEVSITKGIPSFNIVGLPNTEIRESRERVRSAILNSGFKFPLGRITVNLAPANIKKEGSLLDLCIATGILIASKQVEVTKDISRTIILGELSLDGYIKNINGAVPILIDAKNEGYVSYVLPEDNFCESKFVQDVEVSCFKDLKSFIAYVQNGTKNSVCLSCEDEEFPTSKIQFEDVLGHISGKRALQISVAGFHNIILYGPVGSGKTMLAKSIKSILPRLDYEQSLEKGRVYSTTSIREKFDEPAFREVYHTSSNKTIFGSGVHGNVGEVTLSNNGVLFLDEMLEFKRETLESLRKVVEDRKVFISRRKEFLECPANFILLGATNLCPCGNYLNNSAIKQCTCDTVKRDKYINKLSKSLMDRIDIFSYVPVIDYLDVELRKDRRMTSKNVLDKIITARNIQKDRFLKFGIRYNSEMNNELVSRFCKLKPSSSKILETIYRNENISTRSYFKILKIARTIADLDDKLEINDEHIFEVINYRKFITKEAV